MKKNKEIDLELMTSFLRAEFPKKRIKVGSKSKRFTPGIIIPSNYTNTAIQYFPIKTTVEVGVVRHALIVILQKFFGFEEDIINIAVCTYLGIF